MNRLVLIGNGFDLAHDLKTSYADFINWYYEKKIKDLCSTYDKVLKDDLCSFRYLGEGLLSTYFIFHPIETRERDYGRKNFENLIQNKDGFESRIFPLFEKIRQGIISKTWGGIEQDYYDLLKEYAFRDKIKNPIEPPIKALNQQLRYLQQLLIEYLQIETQKEPSKIQSIGEAIYAPFKIADMSIDGVKQLEEHKKYWEQTTLKDEAPIEEKIGNFGLGYSLLMHRVQLWKESQRCNAYPDAFLLPNDIMFLNFNYTDTAQLYIQPRYRNQENHIHGKISKPESIIFGYGDELDDRFKELKEHKNNACLSHIKSIRYLEAPNYRRMLSFIESDAFQVVIMGHSCGNSDRTLLNTIFEHKNCVSIKPYYYITDKKKMTDNYTELVQHISRNFNDMKLMRDRVVNKTQCEPLVTE